MEIVSQDFFPENIMQTLDVKQVKTSYGERIYYFLYSVPLVISGTISICNICIAPRLPFDDDETFIFRFNESIGVARGDH